MNELGFTIDRSGGSGARLLAGTSIFALALTAAAPALAQPATPAASAAQAANESATGPGQPNAATGNTIIVTGIRASLQSARDRKRKADQIVDSISAQDIGAPPA